MVDEFQMIQYIHEIPDAIRKTLQENHEPLKKNFEIAKNNKIQKILIVGVGSSYTAAKMVEPLVRRYCSLQVQVLPATELSYYPFSSLNSQTMVLAVSRSGERGWVVDCLIQANKCGAMTVAITGTADSLLAQNAKHVLLTREGPEITFAKTKSVSACCALLMNLILLFSHEPQEEINGLLMQINKLPDTLREVLNYVEPQVKALIPDLSKHRIVMIGGTSSNYGAALEFGIKLQETAAIPVICNDTGNVLHGPWSSMDSDWLVVLLANRIDRDLCEKVFQLTHKLNGHRLLIADVSLEFQSGFEYQINLPGQYDPCLSALMYLVPLQLITYYLAVAREMNPDTPNGMRDMLNAMLPEGREEPEFRNVS